MTAKNPLTVCQVSGCAKKIKSRNMCSTHYTQWRRESSGIVCKVDGCDKFADTKRGWCHTHYEHWRKYNTEPTLYITHPPYFCTKCKTQKTKNDFWINNTRKNAKESSKRQWWCIECLRERNKETYVHDPVNIKRRHLSEYDLTFDDYKKIYENQNGECAICHVKKELWKPEGLGSRSKFLCIDHHHETGKVRGLLCSHCNLAIGQMKENPNTLQNAISYLEMHSGGK